MRFPYAEVEIRSTGEIHDEAQRRAAVELVASSGATDVLVLCHGWNNDIPRARRLYEQLTGTMSLVRPAVPLAGSRTLAVVGVLWPSVRWSDEDEMAGHGLGVEDEAGALVGAIGTRIEDPERAAHLTRLVPELARSAAARRQFLAALREQVPAAPAEPPAGAGAVDEDPPPAAFLAGDPEAVFPAAGGPEFDVGLPERPGGAADTVAGRPAVDTAGPAADLAGTGGAAVGATRLLVGGAAGFGFDPGDVLRQARGLLNLTSYYTMKERAGRVGAGGIAALLSALATSTAPGPRLHLAGHSFGARALAAAAARHPRLHSITLMQGAFSHHGFAVDFNGQGQNGFFRSVLASRQLTGPVLVTHTANDRAVGLAYAAASRLARQAGAGLGDASDPYGGIGRNGALKTPEAIQPGVDLLKVGGAYHFQAGQVYNLRADTFVRSHGDVTGQQVAYALYCAVSSE